MDSWGFLERAAELARCGESFALATVVWRQAPSSGKEGCRAIITGSGQVHGWIGGACAEPVVIREAQRVIAEGSPRLLLLGQPEQFGGMVPEGVSFLPISCQSEGALEVYVEPAALSPHLVVVGQSPMTATLVELARALGWRAEAIADQDFSAAHAGERSMVVVATQGHNDEDAVQAAVQARPAYLGLVGSARRGAAVLGYLAERGVPQDELGKVHVPAGLDLGHTSHQEIAVAILAELVKLRASGEIGAQQTGAGAAAGAGSPAAGPTVRSGAGPTAAGSTAAGPSASGPTGAGPTAAGPTAAGPTAAGPTAADRAEQEEAVDPVCGMTIPAAPPSLPLRRDGATYWFCCAHCRHRFEDDPAAYARKETRC